MQARKHKIFQGKNEGYSNLPVERHQENPVNRGTKETMTVNSGKESKRERVNVFKASRVYKRSNTEPKHRYNVEHIRTEGTFCTCNMFDCNKTEESGEEKRNKDMNNDPKTQMYGPNDETMQMSMKKVAL